MENNSLDLRSVIGIFFIILSVLLLVTSFVTENGSAINRDCGIIFLLFGLIMYLLSWRKKNKAKTK